MALSHPSRLIGSPSDLDSALYQLSDEELEFLSRQTGIEDAVELKEHIIDVQREAYAVRTVYCVRKIHR